MIHFEIQEFLTHDGIKKISELVKHDHVDETMRFLFLYVSVFPKDFIKENCVFKTCKVLLSVSGLTCLDIFFLGFMM